METFTEPRDLIANPDFTQQRQAAVQALDLGVIDQPIVGIVSGFSRLASCFTLQSCYGHFLYEEQQDSHDIRPLPETDRIQTIDYRLAYIALCIENSDAGIRLLNDLKQMTTIDPENIQFGSADWFWERQVNSYALQIEPARHQYQDRADIGYAEAIGLERIRDRVFLELAGLVEDRLRHTEES